MRALQIRPCAPSPCVPSPFNPATSPRPHPPAAIGTTVMQLREVPARPSVYNGALCLFKLVDGVDEAAIRAALEAFGEVVKVHIEEGGSPAAIVHFTTHEAAVRAKQSGARLTHIATGVDTRYNERSYDDRGW